MEPQPDQTKQSGDTPPRRRHAAHAAAQVHLGAPAEAPERPGGAADPLPGGAADPLPGGAADPLPGGAADPLPDSLPDPAVALRDQLRAIALRAGSAASWLESSRHYAQLINHAGYVPLTARFGAEDLAFLGRAREELQGFAELGIRLVELHQPLDADGITDSNNTSPLLRCRSCMWRWPCPTFRIIAEVLEQLNQI